MSTTVPNLLFSSKVVIEQTDEDKVIYDHKSRETKNFIPKKSSFIIDAQVVWEESLSAKSLPAAQPSGTEEKTFGYLILREVDLKAIGKSIERNDKIIKISDRNVVFYIYKVIPASHYDGFPTLYKVVFTDRRSTNG